MRKDNVLRALARGCTACAVLGLAGAAQAQLSEDWSSGTENGWTATSQAGLSNWVFDSAAGEWFGDDIAGIESQYLTSPTFVLGTDLGLVVEHWFDMENGFDGGVLEISVNGGAFTYVPDSSIFLGQHYNINDISACCGNPLQLLLAFTNVSDSGAGAFVSTLFDLSSFAAAGDTVQVRFNLSTDGSVTDDGWYITRVATAPVDNPSGACCFPNGSCADSTLAECAPSGGDFHEGVACGEGLCPVLIPNDECETATILSLGGAVAGTTAGATGFDVASCGADEHDVWYAFLPDPNTTYRASTTGATDNVSLAVFQQECPPAGFELACGDPSSTDAWAYFTSDAIGSAVFIRVATDETGSADFSVVVDLAPPPPANDDCANAQVVNPGDSVSGSNAVATTDGATTCGFNGNSDVWFSLTPPVSGAYTIDTCGSDYDTTLAIFDGCGGTQLACNDDDFSNCGAQSTLSNLQLVGGTTYVIRLAAYGTGPTEGNYTLTLSPAPIATGACCNAESCSVQSESDCLAGGGSYNGDGTSCGSTPNAASSPNASIPDATPTGTSDSITISESETITTLEVQVDVEHTWMGDLILTLQGPNGAIIDLVNRAGQVGGAGVGDSTELGALYVFSDAGAQTLPDAGAPLLDTDVVPAGMYLPSTLENGVQSLNTAFAGIDAAGIWTLTVSDNAAVDTGTLHGWGLLINGGLGDPCDATPTCACETDGDANQVNVFDLLSYLDLWFPSDAGADIDGDPGVDVFDLLFYLDCWFPASAGNPC